MGVFHILCHFWILAVDHGSLHKAAALPLFPVLQRASAVRRTEIYSKTGPEGPFRGSSIISWGSILFKGLVFGWPCFIGSQTGPEQKA